MTVFKKEEIVDIIEAVKTRISIRGYKTDPVPKNIIEEILEISSRAPSSMNTQPWEFAVIAGDALKKLCDTHMEKLNAGETPGMESNWGGYEGVYRERQVTLGKTLFQLMDIAREDRDKRQQWMLKGFRCFDAPAVIIISFDTSLGEIAQFDIGAISQTIALVALNYGLGTCLMTQGIMFPKVIREIAGIPESKTMSICITIGYPDDDFPANKLYSEREALENNTTWCD